MATYSTSIGSGLPIKTTVTTNKTLIYTVPANSYAEVYYVSATFGGGLNARMYFVSPDGVLQETVFSSTTGTITKFNPYYILGAGYKILAGENTSAGPCTFYVNAVEFTS